MKLNDRGMFRLEDRVLFEAAYEKEIYCLTCINSHNHCLFDGENINIGSYRISKSEYETHR